jgi:hypothetical protein
MRQEGGCRLRQCTRDRVVEAVAGNQPHQCSGVFTEPVSGFATGDVTPSDTAGATTTGYGVVAWRSRKPSTRRHASSDSPANSSCLRSKKLCGARG